MRKITIDEGNTSIKLALFDNDILVSKYNNIDLNFIKKILPKCDRLILSTVKHKSNFESLFLNKNFILLNKSTPLPIKVLYKSPTTLGNDRIALAVGAVNNIPNSNILVIDVGTCITYDFINAKKEYIGGGISLGIHMRYNALNKYTNQLPLIKLVKKADLVGKDTISSIHSGVINGITNEIDGIIERYIDEYPGTKVILTGGDAKFFDKALKNTIFANPNLLMEGLNKILDYNESYF
tara:strand:+ start:70 stop:783 length:714 start_codon:yes stop_codon:yes gene_type:complete